MEKIKLNGLDETIYHDVCSNGLQIYLYVNEKIKNFYATLNVRYGAIDTAFSFPGKKKITKVPNGIAHFLEHLKFNQPGGITANEYFGKLGSNINAFTSHDFTAYEVFASNHFKENVEYLLDYVQTPYFTKKDVQKEKGIIIEEIRMYEDTPSSVLYNKTNECLFQKDNRRFLVSGTVEDVKKTTVDDIRNVYDAFYHPENMFLVITGNFSPEQAINIVKENQSKKDFPKYLNPIKKTEKEPLKVAKEYLELKQNIELPKIKMSFKMKRSNFKDIDTIDLKLYLNSILNSIFGATSTLKEELLKKELISGDIIARSTVRNQYVILSIITESHCPNEIAKVIKEALENIKISTNDLERKKKSGIAAHVLSYDDIESVNNEIQDNIIYYNQIITDLTNRIRNLNLKSTNKVIKGIKIDNSSTVVLYPLSREE